MTVEAWLRGGAARVAAVHCKAGKGRTGTAIAAFFLHARAVASADATRSFPRGVFFSMTGVCSRSLRATNCTLTSPQTRGRRLDLTIT
jgi:hypothetical protein